MVTAARQVIASNWKNAEELGVNQWRKKLNNIIILEYLTVKIHRRKGFKVSEKEEDWFEKTLNYLGRFIVGKSWKEERRIPVLHATQENLADLRWFVIPGMFYVSRCLSVSQTDSASPSLFLFSPPPSHLTTADIIMDPDTAHPLLILSEGGKKVERGNKQQELPDNIERFNKLTSVLGCEGFTAGRHFWEVVLGGEGLWALGVARKSVRRKGFFPFSPEKGFWAVGKINHGYCVLNPPDYVPLSGEPERIRVTLDYQGKQVSFFNAETGALIYTFLGASFSDETLLPVATCIPELWDSQPHITNMLKSS
uniref:B30.2/SPRY domain-containing protein n=1 Tax=Podarcis muralis TaxID=64176 RepID=A0A670HZT9_PODMU